MTKNDLKKIKEINNTFIHSCSAHDPRLAKCRERNNERVFCGGDKRNCELNPLSLTTEYPVK